MTFATQAVSINLTALEKNLPKAGDGYAIPGETPKNFDNFDQVNNTGNPNDVAYFFADYAQDKTNFNAPHGNLVISTKDPQDGGNKLIDDMVSWSGDDEFLTEAEMQEWAKKKDILVICNRQWKLCLKWMIICVVQVLWN